MNNNVLDKYSSIFFIGIGGISMSALSEIMNKEGKAVAGSDQNESDITRHLSSLGITIFKGHDAKHITKDYDLVVYSAAIKPDNVEYAKAVSLQIDMMNRAEFLGHIMENYNLSIGVAGTHGKTTTTSMLSHIMLSGQLDPTISVGGILKGIGGNFRIGSSDYFITEACEYTNSYHQFFPNISIVLNVEEDHMDFFKNIQDIRQSFKTYLENTKTGGIAIINDGIDDIPYLTQDIKASVITVGKNINSTYSYKNPVFDDKGCATFDLYNEGHFVRSFKLNVNGYHNIENALASIAAGRFMGISYDAIQMGFNDFKGTNRRFELLGSFNGAKVIDDYAHHPTEIAMTLEAVSKMDYNNLYIVFQPHTYTRTKALFSEFVDCLSKVDHLIVTDIYAAREKDPGDIHSKMLVESLSKFGKDIVYIDDFEQIEKYLKKQLVPNDMLITLGAGNVNSIGKNLISK